MPIQINGFKVCGNTDCTQTNPQSIANFHKDKNNNDGLTNRCQCCNNARKIAWNRANPSKCRINSIAYVRSGKRKLSDDIYYKDDKVKTRRATNQLMRLYGITLEQKQQMADAQKHKCANVHCSYAFKNLSDAHVDHNHETKKVRGLLCGSCNRALGLLKDDENRIIGLATYRHYYNTP